MLNIDVDRANTVKFAGLEFSWWGILQAHKWRWHGTHIDLGPLSIYGIKRQWLWLPLAWDIWPLRAWYHWRYCRNWEEKFDAKMKEWGE